MSFYNGITKLLAKPIRRIFRITVTGAENLPEEGGCILCANHTSLNDVFVICVSIPRQPRFMAKKELFRIPILAQIIRGMGAFPVDRGNSDVSAIRKSISLVKSGEMVSVFPQGHRINGRCARGTEIKGGAGLIAYRTEKSVIPVYLKADKYHVRPFHPTEVIIGKAIEAHEFGFTSGGREEYDRASKLIFDRICDLGGEE